MVRTPEEPSSPSTARAGGRSEVATLGMRVRYCGELHLALYLGGVGVIFGDHQLIGMG